MMPPRGAHPDGIVPSHRATSPSTKVRDRPRAAFTSSLGASGPSLDLLAIIEGGRRQGKYRDLSRWKNEEKIKSGVIPPAAIVFRAHRPRRRGLRSSNPSAFRIRPGRGRGKE